MWLFHPLGFASIVANEADKTDRTLVARSRFAQDLRKLFPGCVAIQTPKRDYLYRAVVSRKAVAKRIAELAASIDYTNFKDTVPTEDRVRHDAYFDVWEAMYVAQQAQFPRRRHYSERRYHLDTWAKPLTGKAKIVKNIA
jgi:hypothetical protein